MGLELSGGAVVSSEPARSFWSNTWPYQIREALDVELSEKIVALFIDPVRLGNFPVETKEI